MNVYAVLVPRVGSIAVFAEKDSALDYAEHYCKQLKRKAEVHECRLVYGQGLPPNESGVIVKTFGKWSRPRE